MFVTRFSGAALLAGFCALAGPALSAPGSDLMTGKLRTERTIELEVLVDAPPAQVYELWTTEDGIRRFFAPKARIGAHPGEEYTVYFAPDMDPEGLSHGTRGAHLLAMEPGRSLSFEWITFAGDELLGDNGPPMAERSLRDAQPLPTWVELRFEPLDGGKRTRVIFHHYGFRSGPLWEESYAWFGRAWKGVLDNLKASVSASG
jgi:uncharacterized protein YndB with AHSA1/START domain